MEIPKELLGEIVSHLDRDDRFRVARIDRRFRSATIEITKIEVVPVFSNIDEFDLEVGFGKIGLIDLVWVKTWVENNLGDCLSAALTNGRFELSRLLLRKLTEFGEFSTTDAHDAHVLIYQAHQGGNIPAIQMIESAIGKIDSYPEAILWGASRNGSIDLYEWAVKRHQIPLDRRRLNTHLRHVVMKANNIKMIDHLLSKGADDFDAIILGTIPSKQLEMIRYLSSKYSKGMSTVFFKFLEFESISDIQSFLQLDPANYERGLEWLQQNQPSSIGFFRGLYLDKSDK